MAVRLESQTRRYIGLSTDQKPYIGSVVGDLVVSTSDLPAGSSFMEADTGNIFRWDGSEWHRGDSPEVTELREIKSLLTEFVESVRQSTL